MEARRDELRMFGAIVGSMIYAAGGFAGVGGVEDGGSEDCGVD